MKKQILLTTFFILLLGGISFSQKKSKKSSAVAFFEYGHCLKEVSFYGVAGEDDYIRLKKDISEVNIDPPHFLKSFPGGCGSGQPETIEVQYPVAYVSGTKARVRAVFVTDCTHDYWLRGQVRDESGAVMFEFPKKQVSPLNGEAVFEDNNDNPISTTTEFQPGVVMYYGDFAITWELSEDGVDNWIDIDVSHNPLNEYYDPSYGTPKKGTTSDWEDGSVDVVIGTIFALVSDPQNNPIDPPQFYFWVKETNVLGTAQLNFD